MGNFFAYLFFVFYTLLNSLELISNPDFYRCKRLASGGNESRFMSAGGVIYCFFSRCF
ncbi:hypothetical protein PG5_41880 [Pseudomonas sp. G5(2012)]|nr:hypothetical protein PG5_41880 [Pseudomonas sp. G5(2012)]